VKDGKLEFAATSATVFFTLDGSDPRGPGGKPSPAAQKYEQTLPAASPMKVRARARTGATDSGEWSALIELDR
jgi:hypothetical protein